MSETGRGFNRWWVVVGALVIQVSLGAVYIWSVFQTPLKAAFPSWTETQVTLPAQIVLAVFALAVIFGGRIQDRLGPRVVATAGGLILGVGLILASFTNRFADRAALYWLLLTYAVLGGAGIGAGYVCPIATCVKWFPDKRGLITGLAVAGFGAGAFFFAPLARGLIGGTPYNLFNVDLFGLPELGVFRTFLALGVIFLVAVVAGAQLLRNPPPGYVPAGWTPPAAAAGAAPKADFGPREMLCTPVFWLLWLTYLAGCAAGLMVIMKASPIWQSFRIGALTPPVSAEDFKAIGTAGAMAVSILAVFNSLGRILWGKISDVIGRRPSLVAMFFICAGGMLALDWMRSYPLYLLGVCVIGLCFGGFLAMYPAVTADFFGTKHIGVNYGWMFSAYGVGGLAGPWLAARLMKVVAQVPYFSKAGLAAPDKTFAVGDYRAAFLTAGVACVLAGLLMLAVRKPERPAPA
ncbi:MAG: OFA family MFS transporter [Kiritimatiellae bacterium]|nr:OFA family MFS transporter [Kiritimatiellia bacterium]